MQNDRIALCKQSECTGCGACAGACNKSAIAFIENQEGFLYPKIDEGECVSCHLCEKACPVINPVERIVGGTCYAAWSKDFNIRTHSSSGGIFSELAISVINQGGIVIGASLDDKTGFVRHIVISSKSDLIKIQGSKYVQSTISLDILKEIKRYLRNGQKVLFTGTPCQVAGVISLTHNPDNLFTMDVVCHGVPSPKLFANIHKSVRDRIKHFQNYNFRQLSDWSVCSNVNVNVNGKLTNQTLTGLETLYQDAFLKGYLHRENCYTCSYANTYRVSDITVADFWGIGDKSPINEDYKLGCSMMLVNSEKGNDLFSDIKERIFYEIRDINETIDAGNDQLKEPSHRPMERDTFYQDAYSKSFKELIEKYDLKYKKKPSYIVRLKGKIKSVLRLLK